MLLAAFVCTLGASGVILNNKWVLYLICLEKELADLRIMNKCAAQLSGFSRKQCDVGN